MEIRSTCRRIITCHTRIAMRSFSIFHSLSHASNSAFLIANSFSFSEPASAAKPSPTPILFPQPRTPDQQHQKHCRDQMLAQLDLISTAFHHMPALPRSDLQAVVFKQRNTLQCSIPATPPWLLGHPCANFDRHRLYKDDTALDIFRSMFYEICASYDNFDHIYTDGSKMGDRVASAAICSNMVRSSRLPNNASIVRAELYTQLPLPCILFVVAEAPTSLYFLTRCLALKPWMGLNWSWTSYRK